MPLLKNNPQRIRTDMDVRGIKQKRDLCYAQISSLKSVHGGTLFNRPAVNFFSCLGSTTPISKGLRRGRIGILNYELMIPAYLQKDKSR